jgi:hypothetical protein
VHYSILSFQSVGNRGRRLGRRLLLEFDRHGASMLCGSSRQRMGA